MRASAEAAPTPEGRLLPGGPGVPAMLREAVWGPDGDTGYEGDVADRTWWELRMEAKPTNGRPKPKPGGGEFIAVNSSPKKDLLRKLDTPVAEERLDARVQSSALTPKLQQEAFCGALPKCEGQKTVAAFL